MPVLCFSLTTLSIAILSEDSLEGAISLAWLKIASCEFQNLEENSELFAASDAFFPFVDGIEKLVQSGVTAVIQPSGSKNDKEIIKFANLTNTILVFSKTRHFNH